MFVAASFSLLCLLVFRPLVRGGDGAEMPSDSDLSSDLEESESTSFEGEDPGSARPTASGAAGAAATTGSGGPGSSPTGEGSSSAAVASGAWTSSSCSASKLFWFSRCAPAVGVPFGA